MEKTWPELSSLAAGSAQFNNLTLLSTVERFTDAVTLQRSGMAHLKETKP